MGHIYKITNTVNGKSYVGQTRQTIELRWKQHIRDSFKPCRSYTDAIHRAIRKHGVDAFTVEQIEKCDNSELNAREVYWIDKLDTRKHGYNMCIGGGGGAKCEDTKLVELWQDGLSTKEVAKAMGLCKATVIRQLKANGFTEEVYKRQNEQRSKQLSLPVHQYDAEGNYMASYPSKAEAKKALGIDRINVTPTIRLTLYGGYQWRRYKVDKIPPIAVEKSGRNAPTRVHQYTLDGQYVRTFDSFADAARAYGLSGGAFISDVCKGRRRTAYGYRWSFEKVDRLPRMVRRNKLKNVVRVSKDGHERKVYASLKEAAKVNNVTSANIVSVCRGRAKTCGGYVWEYYTA